MPARRAARDAGIAVYTAEDEGVNDEGLPTGLLMWGQAGVYNAVDDRYAMAALCGDRGVVRPARLTAGTGLTVNVAAGWLAVASCEDGTRAAIGSRQTHQMTLPAGPATGTTVLYLWCDTDPDAGTWTLRFVSQAETIGRAGVPLARVDMPAQANLASRAVFSHMVPTLGPRCETTWREATSTASADLTPRYPIAPHQVQAHRMWRLRAYGGGNTGTARANPRFDLTSGGQNSGVLMFDTNPGAADGQDLPPRSEINWSAECIMAINPGRDLVRLTCQVTLTNATRGGTRYGGSVTGVRTRSLTRLWAADWYFMVLRASWSANTASQSIVCFASSFEMMEPEP